MPIIVPPEQTGALRAGQAAMQGQLAAAQIRQRGAEAMGQGFAGFGQGIGQGLSTMALREQQERQQKEELAQREKMQQQNLVARGDAEFVHSPQNQHTLESLQNQIDLTKHDDSIAPEDKQFFQELYQQKLEAIGPPTIFRMKEKPRTVAGLEDGQSREWRDPDTNEYYGEIVNVGGKIEHFAAKKQSDSSGRPGKVTPQMLSEAGNEVLTELVLSKPEGWSLESATPEERQRLRTETIRRAKERQSMLNEANGFVGEQSPTSQPAKQESPTTQPATSQPAAPAMPVNPPVIRMARDGKTVQLYDDGRYHAVNEAAPTSQPSQSPTSRPTTYFDYRTGTQVPFGR